MLLFLVIPCLVVAFQPCMEWMPVKKNPTGDLPTQEDYSSPSLLWLYFHEKFFSFTLFFIFIWNLLKCNISCETKTSNFGTKMPYMRNLKNFVVFELSILEFICYVWCETKIVQIWDQKRLVSAFLAWICQNAKFRAKNKNP